MISVAIPLPGHFIDPAHDGVKKANEIRGTITTLCSLISNGVLPPNVAVPLVSSNPEGIDRDQTIAENISKYLKSRKETKDAQVLVNPKTCGSLKNEVFYALKTVSEVFPKETLSINFISDKDHMFRVKLSWYAFRSRHWSGKFFLTSERLSFRERTFREPVARAFYAISLLPNILKSRL